MVEGECGEETVRLTYDTESVRLAFVVEIGADGEICGFGMRVVEIGLVEGENWVCWCRWDLPERK